MIFHRLALTEEVSVISVFKLIFCSFTLIPTLNQKCEVWKVGKGGRVEIICVEERSCQLGYPSYAPGPLLPQGFLGAIP